MNKGLEHRLRTIEVPIFMWDIASSMQSHHKMVKPDVIEHQKCNRAETGLKILGKKKKKHQQSRLKRQ